MKTVEKKLAIIHSCLCNGLYYFPAYGFELDWDDAEYANAKEALLGAGAVEGDLCIEDVQTQMIRMGFSLNWNDEEGEGDNNAKLNLVQIKKNWNKIPLRYLAEMEDENDDANTGDCILQYILFGELVYG